MDPLEHLPSESASRIFSFLSTSCLARSELVSSKWKDFLVQNPFLYQTLDFLKINEKYPLLTDQEIEKEISEQVKGLLSYSQRSKSRLISVSIDLTLLWNHFEYWSDWSETEKEDWENRGPLIKIFKTLRDSSETLKKIKMVSRFHARENPECGFIDTILVKHLVNYFNSFFPSLREIELILPCEVELKSELSINHSNGKRFSLVNNKGTEENERECTFDSVMNLIKEVEKFIGERNLTHFKFDYDCGGEEESFTGSHNKKLIKKISESKAKLVFLDFGSLTRSGMKLEKVFNAFTSCPSLSTFKFTGKIGESWSPTLLLEVPNEFVVSTQMKCVDLKLMGINVLWNEKMKERLGNSLIEFNLHYQKNYSQESEDPHILPFNYLTSILNLNSKTLKILKLDGTRFQLPFGIDDETDHSAEKEICLPSLKDLSLKCLTNFTKQFLLRLKNLSHLSKVEISTPKNSITLWDLEEEGNYVDFEILWKILITSDSISTLEVLNLSRIEFDSKKLSYHLELEQMKLVFLELKVFEYKNVKGDLRKFFEGCQFPKFKPPFFT